MLNTDVFISCVIFWLHTPETLGLIFCTLVFHFRGLGSGQLFILSPFFGLCILALQVFTRGCLEYAKSQEFIFFFFGTSLLIVFWDSKGIWSFLKYLTPQGIHFCFFLGHMLLGYLGLQGFHFSKKKTWLDFTLCQPIRFLFLRFFLMLCKHHQDVTCQPLGFHFGQNMLAL